MKPNKKGEVTLGRWQDWFNTLRDDLEQEEVLPRVRFRLDEGVVVLAAVSTREDVELGQGVPDRASAGKEEAARRRARRSGGEWRGGVGAVDALEGCTVDCGW